MHEQVSQINTNDTEGEIDVEDAFGEHDIAYWIREGQRLVPATPTQIATIQEREALLRLAVSRSDYDARPHYASHLRRIVLFMRRWVSLPLAHSRQPDTQTTMPTTDTHATTSLTQTQQTTAQERHISIRG